MVTTCTGCRTRFRLDDARVPRRRIRVRCPRCASVFQLDGTQLPRPAVGEDGLVIERSGGSFFMPAQPETPASAPAAAVTPPGQRPARPATPPGSACRRAGTRWRSGGSARGCGAAARAYRPGGNGSGSRCRW